MATFLCMFRNDGIFSPACWGGGARPPPPFTLLYLPPPFELPRHFQPLPSNTIDRKLPVLSHDAPLLFSLVKHLAGKITRFAFNNVASRITYKRTWHVKKAVFCARLPTGRPQLSSDLVPFFRNNYEHFPWVSKFSWPAHTTSSTFDPF